MTLATVASVGMTQATVASVGMNRLLNYEPEGLDLIKLNTRFIEN